MKKIIQLFISLILFFSIFLTPLDPLKLTTQKNEVQAFGGIIKIIVNVLKGTVKKTPVKKTTKFNKNNFVLPPMNPKIRTYKGKKQVQTTYPNGDTKWIPINNQKYKNKTLTNKQGKKIKYDKNGFPKFPHKFQITLKNTSLKLEREKHEKEANKALNKALNKAYENEKNKKIFKKKFNPSQIEKIKKGQTPTEYAWHHNQKRGLMQLVHKSYHDNTSHTGGIAIWGRN